MAKYTKKEWKPEYQKILIYAEQGMPIKDIAEKVNMHPVYVGRIMKREAFVERKQQFEEKITDKARKIFEDYAVEAAKKIVKLARSGTSEDRIRFDAAKEVLYQVGMKPIEVIETRKREYTPEELSSMNKTALEVEAIADRIGSGDSNFVLTDETGVNKADAKTETEPASADRQEIVPEQPVLPV